MTTIYSDLIFLSYLTLFSRNVTAKNVQINAIFYNANGKVVDVDTEYVNIGSGLLPGTSQSFSMEPFLNYENRDKIVS